MKSKAMLPSPEAALSSARPSSLGCAATGSSNVSSQVGSKVLSLTLVIWRKQKHEHSSDTANTSQNGSEVVRSWNLSFRGKREACNTCTRQAPFSLEPAGKDCQVIE
eukprot:CAMPEP_0115191614 /NCGR_PEP_ID=MMETSP0270-20121206/12621_1 /TAXON_ID=71861 /ORGANISM="Scrippsiella trochoidea, Strain CCMP3099" /LENGTH=106 /DNA_ID=CAMNT_0002604841 /DNA_START=323 /DNA_END=643 /DNA_ORIENTATION=+